MHRPVPRNAPLTLLPPIAGSAPFALSPGPQLSRDPGIQAFHVARWHGYGDTRKLRELRRFAESYGADPRMARFMVQNILVPAGVQQREYAKQAAAILDYVQRHVYYVNEPGERVVSPWVTLEWGFGDCDDVAILVAALAHSIRMPWRFVLAGRDRRGVPVRWTEPVDGNGKRTGRQSPPMGAKFYHIYVELGWPPFAPTTWASAEPTIKGAPLGYDPVWHGPRRDAHLQRSQPASWGQDMDVQPAGEEDGAPVVRFVHKFSWGEILKAAVQSALSTLLAAALLAALRRRRRRTRA